MKMEFMWTGCEDGRRMELVKERDVCNVEPVGYATRNLVNE